MVAKNQLQSETSQNTRVLPRAHCEPDPLQGIPGCAWGEGGSMYQKAELEKGMKKSNVTAVSGSKKNIVTLEH